MLNSLICIHTVCVKSLSAVYSLSKLKLRLDPTATLSLPGKSSPMHNLVIDVDSCVCVPGRPAVPGGQHRCDLPLWRFMLHHIRRPRPPSPSRHQRLDPCDPRAGLPPIQVTGTRLQHGERLWSILRLEQGESLHPGPVVLKGGYVYP